MAVKTVRKRRKNADGTYDIVHYETQAKVVWMSDGRSVEEAVAKDGGGTMLKSAYDPDDTVANAGGIVGFVNNIVGSVNAALDEINGEVV